MWIYRRTLNYSTLIWPFALVMFWWWRLSTMASGHIWESLLNSLLPSFLQPAQVVRVGWYITSLPFSAQIYRKHFKNTIGWEVPLPHDRLYSTLISCRAFLKSQCSKPCTSILGLFTSLFNLGKWQGQYGSHLQTDMSEKCKRIKAACT